MEILWAVPRARAGDEVMDEGEQFVEEMLDAARLGKEPSKTYFDRLNVLSGTISQCSRISQSYGGIPSPTPKHFYASVLFTMMITRATSLAILAPFSPFTDKAIEHWDYASATGIVRTMLELRLAFYYLCVDPCGTDEWDCRWNLFNLHDCRARVRLIETSSNDPSILMELEAQAEELRDRLRANSFFAHLPGKRASALLKGETAYLESLEDIGVKAGVQRREFQHLYRMFSSHVHALPMSFFRIGDGEDGRGRGLPTPAEEGYTTLCLTYALTLLVYVRDDFQELFKEITLKAVPEHNVREPAEVKLGESHFKIGQTVSLEEGNEIRINVKRTSLESIEVAYVYLPTGDVVLRRSEKEGEGGSLEWFDQMFWTVLINGAPTTERAADEALRGRMAFKIDHLKRTISFKIED
jgi:hypothetical protein